MGFASGCAAHKVKCKHEQLKPEQESMVAGSLGVGEVGGEWGTAALICSQGFFLCVSRQIPSYSLYYAVYALASLLPALTSLIVGSLCST